MNDIAPIQAEFNEQSMLFKKAVSRLKEALDEQETELERDGCIQPFEVCVELMWKTLQSYLNVRHGVLV